MHTTSIKLLQVLNLIIDFNKSGLSDEELNTFTTLYNELSVYGREMIQIDCEELDYVLPPLS